MKKGTYLQIYESFYDPQRKGTAHRSYKVLGYVHELIQKGIDDLVSFYKDEVSRLNQQLAQSRQSENGRQISDETPENLIGYFPLKCINEGLDAKKYIDLMQATTDFRFNVFSLISALVYSRAALPCSKSKTFTEVIPRLYNQRDGYVYGQEIPFMHKSRIHPKELHVNVTVPGSKKKKKKTVRVEQKQMAYYSEKYAKKQRLDRQTMVERAKDPIKHPKKYNKVTSVGFASKLEIS